MSQDPQVVTGSHDTTIKLWDLVAGKLSIMFFFKKIVSVFLFPFPIEFVHHAGRTMCTLTHHKKSVRAMAMHPKELVSTHVQFHIIYDVIDLCNNISFTGNHLHQHQRTT